MYPPQCQFRVIHTCLFESNVDSREEEELVCQQVQFNLHVGERWRKGWMTKEVTGARYYLSCGSGCFSGKRFFVGLVFISSIPDHAAGQAHIPEGYGASDSRRKQTFQRQKIKTH